MDIGKLIAIIFLLAGSALFSSMETAFSGVNKIRLKNYASQGNKKAERALKIANSFDDALTAVLIGNNEDYIALLCAESFVNSGKLFLCHKLFK